MRIRYQLILAVVTSVTVGLVAAVLIANAAREERVASENQALAQMTTHEVSGLLVLTQEYARYAEARAAQQWHYRHSMISNALQSGFDRGTALHELRLVAQSLPELFSRLEDLPLEDDPFTLQRKEVLIDQLLSSTQAMSDLAYQWYQGAALAQRRSEQRFQAFAIITPLVMLAVLMGVALMVRRRVLAPLRALEQATDAVSRGDLSVRIQSDSRDELGHLARQFDRMTEALIRSNEQVRESGALLKGVTDNIPAMVGYFDTEERCLFANTTVLKTQGIFEADTRRHTLRSGLGEENYALHAPHVRKVLAGEHSSLDGHIERRGKDVYFQSHLIPDRSADGTVRGFYVMTFDLTPMRQAEIERSRSDTQLRQITDNLPVLISYLDAQQRIRFANETFRAWVGVDPKLMIGKPMREVIGAEAHEPRRLSLERALQGERVEFEGRLSIHGVERATHTTYIPDVTDSGEVIGVYALTTDVSALKAIEDQLQALARVDTLTGLANRLQFNERLPDALANAAVNGSALGLMFLDIDHFKSINDSQGHAAGDGVLQEFARRLLGSVRGTDTVARLAGDEFVIILEGLREPGELHVIAQKIVDQVNIPMRVDGHDLHVTTSVGVACHAVRGGHVTASELLSKADEALYEAKRSGRNAYRVVVLGPETSDID